MIGATISASEGRGMVTWGTVTTRTQGWLLSMLYAPGATDRYCEPIEGSLRLMKELFLVSREADAEGFYEFEPYRYGPCSFRVYHDLDALKTLGLVMEMPIPDSQYKRYSLTSRGSEVAERIYSRIPSHTRSSICDIKKRFNKASIFVLMAHVYQNYPEMTTRTEWAFRKS